MTGGIPFGFRLASDGVQLVPIEAEQAVLAEIRDMRGEARSCRSIAANLTERGVATKRGARRWSHMAVVGIVKRDAQRC